MSHPGKVVALGDHPRAKSRLSPYESASVLGGCRQIALDRMGAALASMLDKVEEELFALANKAQDASARDTYLDARTHARDRRAAMENAFRLHFVECFDRKVRGDPVSAPRAAAADGELSLVEHAQLEETLAVREMSRRMDAACEGELFALGQRMGFLLQRPDLDPDANPLSPATICDALKDACDQVQAGFKVRLVLLQHLERHAEEEVRHIYRDVNAHLVQRRILPDVKPAVRRANAPRPEVAKSAPAKAKDLFGTLAQMVDAAQAGSGAGVAAVAVPGPLLEELTRMHRAGPPVNADGEAINVLHDLRASPHAATLASVDASTIDIVAMLFDYVFEDRHIPAAAKALLGRLQIPTLKAALLDKSFFSSREHPARRLIDLLAELSIGVDARNPDDPALKLVEQVVDHVREHFETDLAPYAAMCEKVQVFVAARDEAEAVLVERSARVVEERERREIAHAVAAEEVQRRLALRASVPAAVRNMLQQHWVRALATVYTSEGEGTAPWDRLCRVMDELLWSVEPKVTAEDRKRLIATLPTILRDLHEGMDRAKVSEEDSGAFLGVLVDCHALAVKAGLRGLATVPEIAPVPEGAAPRDDPRIEREVVPAGDLQVEEIRLRGARGAVVRNVFTRTGVWTNLQRGTWVEFSGQDAAPTRARLTWISPNKGVYLFTNPASVSVALSVSPEALAEQLRLGEARMLNDAPLVDRAVDSMMAALGSAGGSASAA
jgi:hypothetical protein